MSQVSSLHFSVSRPKLFVNRAFFIAIFLFVYGAISSTSFAETVAPIQATPAVSSTKTEVPNWVYRAAPWSEIKNSKRWTEAALSMIRVSIDRLERARDKEDFCPGYNEASKEQREVCWLRLVGGISKYESSFGPSDAFQEPNGGWSVGLMALSPKECTQTPTIDSLKDPVRNIKCGVQLMAKFVGEEHFITGPSSARGASSYWSVLRTPYEYEDYSLGKRTHIMRITRRYRSFQDPLAPATGDGKTVASNTPPKTVPEIKAPSPVVNAPKVAISKPNPIKFVKAKKPRHHSDDDDSEQ